MKKKRKWCCDNNTKIYIKGKKNWGHELSQLSQTLETKKKYEEDGGTGRGVDRDVRERDKKKEEGRDARGLCLAVSLSLSLSLSLCLPLCRFSSADHLRLE